MYLCWGFIRKQCWVHHNLTPLRRVATFFNRRTRARCLSYHSPQLTRRQCALAGKKARKKSAARRAMIYWIIATCRIVTAHTGAETQWQKCTKREKSLRATAPARVHNGARGQRVPLIYRRLFAPTNGYLSKLILFRESSLGGLGGWFPRASISPLVPINFERSHFCTRRVTQNCRGENAGGGGSVYGNGLSACTSSEIN